MLNDVVRGYDYLLVDYKVYLIGHPVQRAVLGDIHAQAFAEQDLPISYERLDVPPVNFHRVMTDLSRDPSFLGAKVSIPYKHSTLAYCQELSHPAQSIGAVNTIARRPSGLVYGDNTDVLAFVNHMRELGITRVRTALILGAGGAARVALAALRELGCARYMLGYRNPRRPTEISSHFRGIRRQVSFFPLEEMVSFFGWAENSGIFENGPMMPAPGEEENTGRKEDDNIKRWDLLVNATPVGQAPKVDRSLVTCASFLRCFDHILDMVPQVDPTRLEQLAEDARVPVVRGIDLYRMQAQFSRELWLKEYRRHLGEEVDSPGRRRPVFRKRKR